MQMEMLWFVTVMDFGEIVKSTGSATVAFVAVLLFSAIVRVIYVLWRPSSHGFCVVWHGDIGRNVLCSGSQPTLFVGSLS